MRDFFRSDSDKLMVLLVLIVFLGLLVAFHEQGLVSFLEQSANLTLGCLLALVRGQSKEEKKNDNV